MNKLGYIIAFLALLGTCQLPLSGQITFQKSYGDPAIQSEARDILESPDGYIVAGFTINNTTGRDGLLLHLDFQGNVLWENTFDMGKSDEFKSVALAADGGFVAFGITQSPNDLWLVKVSQNGDLIWQKQFPHPANSGLDGTRIHAVPGGHVISGSLIQNGGSSAFAIRVDNNGNVLWSQVYNAPNALMSIGYVTDSLYYAGGSASFNAALTTLDPTTGNIVERKMYQTQGTESLDYIAPSNDGNLVLADYAQPFWPSNKYYQWAQKITPAGEVIWSKIYDFSDGFQYNGPIISTTDGGFLLCPGTGTNNPAIEAILMKINGDGHVNWCHTFGKPNGQEWFLKAIQTSDGGYIAAGVTANNGQPKTSVFVVKTDAKGKLLGCCPNKKAVLETDFPTTLLYPVYTSAPFIQAEESFGEKIPRNSPVQIHSCTQLQPTVVTEIPLCPGETITLGGQTYFQPDTVQIELSAGPGGCDTLATYILTDATLGQNSQISLQCPANIALSIPQGNTFVAVNYAMPTADSDCSCPGLDISIVSGGDSGSNFPLGVSTVCWQAMDACGGTQTCCFTVAVTEQSSACDTKTTACLKWEILSIKQDAAKQKFYSIRLTNTCAASLSYAYFGLPSGITAVSPANNSVYAAASGNQYDVRNPNYSPVYGLRFKPKTGVLNSGQSDVFRFGLPAQISPEYLYVAGRLSNSAFYEAHLNTFNCPVGIETAANERNSENADPMTGFSLLPNPAKSGALLEIRGRAIESGEFLLSHISGQAMFQGKILDNQVQLSAQDLPDGIYFFRVLEYGALIYSGKLVVLR